MKVNPKKPLWCSLCQKGFKKNEHIFVVSIGQAGGESDGSCTALTTRTRVAECTHVYHIECFSKLNIKTE